MVRSVRLSERDIADLGSPLTKVCGRKPGSKTI
jgi:hypothetical protein